MKQTEINKLSAEELKDSLTQAKSEHAELKRLHGMSPLENPSQVTKARKLVARLNTALNSNS